MTILQTLLDERFSQPDAVATRWEEARAVLERAPVSWLTTVRPDGRPHVTPLLTVWVDGSLFLCTGPDERKAHNLGANPHVALTTGANTLDSGLDVVVEGVAGVVADEPRLRRIAAAYLDKYGADWTFEVRDGAFLGAGGRAVVFEVAPVTAYGFRKGEFSQTRWRFGS
jgi:general stress protein 26